MTLLITSRLESWFEVEALGSARSFSAIGSPLLDMDLLWYTPYGEQMSMCKKDYARRNLTGEDRGHMVLGKRRLTLREIALKFSISVFLMRLTIKVLAVRRALCLAALAGGLALTPIIFAQAGKPSDDGKPQGSPSP